MTIYGFDSTPKKKPQSPKKNPDLEDKLGTYADMSVPKGWTYSYYHIAAYSFYKAYPEHIVEAHLMIDSGETIMYNSFVARNNFQIGDPENTRAESKAFEDIRVATEYLKSFMESCDKKYDI